MHKYFVYISLVFLLIALYTADYLEVPQIQAPRLLALSFALLFLGFLADAASWRRILILRGFSVSGRQSIASTGLAIFGKYIPGKLWVILGRSSYLAEKLGGELGRLTLASLQAQFLMLLVGLALGAIPLFLLDLPGYWGWMLVAAVTGVSLLLFSSRLNSAFAILLGRFNITIELPALPTTLALRACPWFFLTWIFWSLSFALLVTSLGGGTFSLIAGLAFPLAGTLGILAVLVPGGIGVREGVLAAFLLGLGLAVEQATTIAVFSRLWFLVGEGFIFVVALISAREHGAYSRITVDKAEDSF